MIVYILKFYPKISEAFILDELCELKRQNVPFAVWALGRWPEETIHPETELLNDHVTYLDREGLGKLRKATALARLWLKRPERLNRAHRLFHKEQSSRFSFTYSQSLPRALELQKMGAKHIHAHFASIAADHALTLSMLSGIPFSFTVHGSDLLVEEHPHLDLITKHAKAVITPSRYNARHAVDNCGFPPKKIRVIPNGVDTERFRPGGDEERESRNILTVARLETIKGIPILIEAYARLKERGLSFHAVVIGDGPERPAIEGMIKERGLGEYVALMGSQPREVVERELRRAGMFVLSSLSEGFPHSILEAMSSGLPVVAPRITGIPEQITEGEHGLLVDPEDAVALADAMQKLLENREMSAQMGRAARDRAEREFSLTHTVGQRIQFFLDNAD